MRHPCGSRRSGWISPPWRSTIHLAIASPSPAPPSRDERADVVPVEAFEDARDLVVGDARPLVADLDRRRDRRAGSHVTATVPPIGEWRTAFSTRLATTWCRRSWSASSSRSDGSTRTVIVHAGRAQLRLAHGLLEQHFEVERLAVERHDTGFEAREIEELLHQPSEPLDLGEHRAQRLGIGGLHSVDEVLEHHLQCGDRRPQLVAHVRDEIAPQPIGLGELGGHGVERPGQRADLVARARR